MRHADGARRRRRRCLALDGGLVLPAVLVHRRYLEVNGWWLADGSGGGDMMFRIGGRVGTFLLCFLRSLGCRGRKDSVSVSLANERLLARP